MAPGPELGVLLAGIDIHGLTGADVVEVLCARARQLSHDQAQLLATMVEAALCDPDASPGEAARLSESPQYAADEIRAALAWTCRAADRELDFAQSLVLRMPAVFTALNTGWICRSKAWVFADLCADLTAEQAEVVCARLLPRATRLTTARLERAEVDIVAATARSPLVGLADAPDPAAVWAGCDIGRRRAVLDTLMTVTVLPTLRPGHGSTRTPWRSTERRPDYAAVDLGDRPADPCRR